MTERCMFSGDIIEITFCDIYWITRVKRENDCRYLENIIINNFKDKTCT